MTGVALPLISIQFHLNAAEKGMVTAASLAGILVGATALGGLADSYGRKRMFIVEMIIFAVFLVGLTFAPNFITLVICLFGAGIALGCDYPTAHMVISESIATSMRGRLVLSASRSRLSEHSSARRWASASCTRTRTWAPGG